MLNLERNGVQCQPPDGAGAVLAVTAVAEQRMTGLGQVHANLVFSTGLENHLQQSCGGPAPQDPHARDGELRQLAAEHRLECLDSG